MVKEARVGAGSPRVGSWLRASLAALAALTLGAPVAFAGVEFVTSTSNCQNKVDQIGDGKDLFISAGPNVKFEVWGNSIDLTSDSGFRIATDSGSGSVSGRITSRHSGPSNIGRGCPGTGSAEIEVDSPFDLTSNIQRSLFFRMPLGDESRLQMTIKHLPSITARWTSAQTDIACIVKTGTFEKLDQDHRLRIQLPPGSATDATTCNQRTIRALIDPGDMGEVDISRKVKYTASNLPSFLTADVPEEPNGESDATMIFTINVAGIRGLTTQNNSNITITSGAGKTTTLTLQVLPGLVNGFTQVANCRNLTTGDTVNANDLVSCELRLSIPPTNGQLITFEVQDRLCVAAGAPGVNYSTASGIGTTTLTGAGNIFQVLLRAVGGTMSTGQPCGSLTSPVQHQVKFWVGQRDIESGADFTLDTFRIRLNP